MRVFGVDFTSVPKRRKAIEVADCILVADTLTFNELRRVEDFVSFEMFLQTPGPWVAGFDFPFAQSRNFIQNIGWPGNWRDYVNLVGELSAEDFYHLLEAYKKPRARGDKEHSRAFEVGTGAASPQKLYGVPVAKMFFQGAPRLLRAGVHLPGLFDGDTSRVGLEAYPGMAARAFLPQRTPYKTEQASKRTALLHEARRSILRELTGKAGRDRFELRIIAPDSLADDPSGDPLDALICAAQAAWGHRHLSRNPHCLDEIDPLEGWISDPEIVFFRNGERS